MTRRRSPLDDRESLLPAMLARFSVDWDTGCWRWTGTVDRNGYGRLGGNAGAGIHRLMYRETVGPIPDGLDLDHTCHNIDLDCPGGTSCLHRRCVNPNHLDPATRRENQRRAQRTVRSGGPITKCKQGHDYDEANTYTDPKGRRQCRACNKLAISRYRARKAARADLAVAA